MSKAHPGLDPLLVFIVELLSDYEGHKSDRDTDHAEKDCDILQKFEAKEGESVEMALLIEPSSAAEDADWHEMLGRGWSTTNPAELVGTKFTGYVVASAR